MIKKFILKYWPALVLLLLTPLISWPLILPGYFSHHDDLQIMRIYEMRQCFADLQIPCRWVPDMGYGNGFPLFNYYGVLAYYIGGVLSYVFGYLWSAKILFFIPLILGWFTMYLLGKELFGKFGGFTVAVLYMFAPYRALDIYVRGAIAESFGMAVVPLVFYFVIKLSRDKTIFNFLGLAFSFGAFLVAHNIMTLLFTPFILVWVAYWVYSAKKNLLVTILALVLGFGLGSFFILPAFLEKSLVQTFNLTNGGTDFRAHYATVRQLFLDRSWEYGGSFFGPSDTISFQIGWPHWWLAIISTVVVISNFIYQRSNPKKEQLFLFVFLMVGFLVSIFMIHNKSTPVWDRLEIIQFTQFPWRFLSLTIFFASLLGGLFVAYFKGKHQIVVVLITATLAIGLNYSFFKPEFFYTYITEKDKLTGKLWLIQQQAGILDYLPITAQEPKGPRPELPEVATTSAKISNFIDRSNHFKFNIDVSSKSAVEVPVFDFPNWRVSVNGLVYPHNHKNRLGRIGIDLDPGKYLVEGNLKDTPVRVFANILTLISITICAGIFIYGKTRKKIK